MVKVKFNFEDLEVWQKAVEFAKKVINLTEEIETGRKHYRLIEQLESSSASIALNIAEGKGRYSKKEFIQFLFIAQGSLSELETQLIISVNLKYIEELKQLKIDVKGI